MPLASGRQGFCGGCAAAGRGVARVFEVGGVCGRAPLFAYVCPRTCPSRDSGAAVRDMRARVWVRRNVMKRGSMIVSFGMWVCVFAASAQNVKIGQWEPFEVSLNAGSRIRQCVRGWATGWRQAIRRGHVYGHERRREGIELHGAAFGTAARHGRRASPLPRRGNGRTPHPLPTRHPGGERQLSVRRMERR